MTIASDLDGVLALNGAHGIWDAALQEEARDLNEYLRRKEREAAAVFDKR